MVDRSGQSLVEEVRRQKQALRRTVLKDSSVTPPIDMTEEQEQPDIM